MNDILVSLLLLGSVVGGILLAIFLCLLPPHLFMSAERRLTEQEFCEVAPAKAWCRHLPTIALIAGFVLHVGFFLLVRATCTNDVVLLPGFLSLFFLWIYVLCRNR